MVGSEERRRGGEEDEKVVRRRKKTITLKKGYVHDASTYRLLRLYVCDF